MSDQPSFRRFLLTRLLLFSIPILLLGMGVTFQKTRSALLEASDMALAERATRRAENMQQELEAVRTNLAIASQSQVIQTGAEQEVQVFLDSLVQQLVSVNCLQVTDPQGLSLQPMMTAGICDPMPPAPPNPESWPPPTLSRGAIAQTRLYPTPLSPNPEGQLSLIIQVPIYDTIGGLRQILTAQVVLHPSEGSDPQKPTVVIDPTGTFLSHPNPAWVGQTVEAIGDSQYETLINAPDTLNSRIFINLETDNKRWLAGVSPVTIPLDANTSVNWTVLAVTPVQVALQPLNSIAQGLILLATGLLAAHGWSALCMARGLARPIEKLSRYTRQIELNQPLPTVPHDLGVREINQLATVLDDMVFRLEERATELEDAWQEADAANRLKNEFLATTSHELRTPLNAIIGCVQLVHDGYCDTRDEEMEMLTQTEKAALHLLKIINDLLDIRSIEVGSIRLFPEALNVCQVLHDVLAMQSVVVQRKQLQLTVSILAQPVWVWADGDRLRQVLLNILANAVKFTDSGCISITTRLESATKGIPVNADTAANPAIAAPDVIIITIIDTGVGISPEQQHKLFRPFGMADASTTRKFEGTGLGLSISRSLIEQMGGRITLFSQGLNQGTCVEITFPVLLDPSTSQDATAAVPPEDAIALHPH